jgi:hypothetical protein
VLVETSKATSELDRVAGKVFNSPAAHTMPKASLCRSSSSSADWSVIILVETWTEERIASVIHFVAERITADFAETGLKVEFRIDPQWSGLDATNGPESVVAVGGGHEFPLHLEGGTEAACWYAAYQMQDDVMGEHGRPWPELVDPSGAFVGVLSLAAEPPQIATWELAGQPFCAVGHLQRACAAAGLRIKAI